MEQEDIFGAGEPELYSEEEIERVEAHIVRYFGSFPKVFHEIISPDIHVDICMIPPSGGRNYYTLVTMGMGAHRMNVPEELAESKLERAELVITLPPDWKLDSSEEEWYWPLRLMKSLARLPIHCDTWLGWGHTADQEKPYASNTGFCGALLIGPQGTEEGAAVCVLPDGDEVNFYHIVPLYPEEIEFKVRYDADTLLAERIADISHILDISRPNTCEDGEPAFREMVMDIADRHLESIYEKQLPVEELAAYNHLAIYLRWCIEKDLMGEQFAERFAGVINDVKNGVQTDLRAFLRDSEPLQGCLLRLYFNEEGEAFAAYYYGDGTPCFPEDVDDYALRYFGEERYHSEEFQDEAYLFVPFDESYYQAMKAVIDQRYMDWYSSRQVITS